MLRILFGIVLAISGVKIHAAEALPLVEKVLLEVTGPGRTDPEALRRILLLKSGDFYDSTLFAEDLGRLRGEERFRSVTASVDFFTTTTGTITAVVTYRIEDRYATLPLFEVESGGGVVRATVGFVDRNFRGNLEELGAYGGYYKSFRGSPIGGAFWGSPYFTRRWDLFTTLSRDYFLHPFYEGITLPPSGILEEERWNAYVQGLYRLAAKWSFGGFFLLRLSENRPFSGALPLPLESHSRYLTFRPGLLLRARDLYYTDFHYQGYDMGGGSYIDLRNQGLPPLPGAFVQIRRFWLWGSQLNLGIRLAISFRSAPTPFDELRVGALDAVRGLPNEYLHGQALAYSSMELRTFFLNLWKERIHIHWAGFVDSAGAFSGSLPSYALSTGGGVRIGFPSVYGLFFRLDLAYLLYPVRTLGIQIGASPFF